MIYVGSRYRGVRSLVTTPYLVVRDAKKKMVERTHDDGGAVSRNPNLGCGDGSNLGEDTNVEGSIGARLDTCQPNFSARLDIVRMQRIWFLIIEFLLFGP